MKNLLDFALQERYDRVRNIRPKLEEMKTLLDWNSFVSVFPSEKRGRGRPAYDKILMVRILFLQSWYSLSDEEIEFQVYDRLSFQQFLDFPDKVPDFTTVWRFREELTQTDTIELIWRELQRQINLKNVRIEKGVIQDATFIHADPGKTNSGMDNRGMAKTSRSRDGSWAKKNGKSHFGFKSHTKMQRGSKIITEVAVTTAKVHDSKIDLASPEEIIYRDTGYTGVKTKAKGNASMKRGNLSIRDKMRNKRIVKKRSQGEHPYGTIHRSFKGGWTKLTTIARVFVQQVFVCMAYNIHRLRFLLES
jgi:IS5 family transposase